MWLTSITEQWAVIAVNGPRVRDLLAPLVQGVDLEMAVFPHLSVRTGTICGVPMRLFRVSFTGELGYEINVPAGYGREIWEKIYTAGAQYGIVPYGTEAMHVLRAEKGFIIVGQETDGTVSPDDVGLGWMVGKSKGDFVGKRSLARPDAVRNDRKQLVGLRVKKRKTALEEGIAISENARYPSALLGHVTSSYWSECAGGPIALALIGRGRSRIGDTLIAQSDVDSVEVEVVPPVFYDPEGRRLDV